MSYTLPNWQDQPSTVTPLSSANLLEYNAAINDIDSRINNSQPGMSVTSTNVSHSAIANQIVLVDTSSAPVTITFPAAPVNGTRVGVKQITRGGTNTVTIQLSGSDVFNKAGGPTTGTITLLNQAGTWLYNSGVWITISDDVPLSQLDTRYTGAVTSADGSIAVGGTLSATTLAVNQAGVSGLVNASQAGGIWNYNVYGDLMSSISRDDCLGSVAYSSSLKTQLVMVGLCPAQSYNTLKLYNTVNANGSPVITAALFGSTSLSSTSWSRLGSGNVTFSALTTAGLLSASLPFSLSVPTYVIAQLVLTTAPTSTYPSLSCGSTATAAPAALINNPSGAYVSANGTSATAPGATLNPTTGFAAQGYKIWCALA